MFTYPKGYTYVWLGIPDLDIKIKFSNTATVNLPDELVYNQAKQQFFLRNYISGPLNEEL